MASAKFLEEALNNTSVDESAVSAIVSSLDTQLVTAASPLAAQQQTQNAVVNQNHVNSAISNGGAAAPPQKHGPNVPNGDSSIDSILGPAPDAKTVANDVSSVAATAAVHQEPAVGLLAASQPPKDPASVKLVYPQANATTGTTIITNQVSFPTQTLPNGNIISPLTQVLTSTSNAVTPQSKIVIKTSTAPSNTPALVSVPMNTTTVVNNIASSVATAGTMPGIVTLAKPTTQQTVTTQNPSATTILPANVQILNVRPGMPGTQPQKGVQSRVVLSAPQMVGARPGQPSQITLQSLQGLQPGQQGHLLLKTENGQYQLLRVGPAPATPGATALPSSTTPVAAPAGTTTYRLQALPAQANSVATATPVTSPVPAQTGTTTAAVTTAATAPVQVTTTPAQVRQTPDTKEKCRKFLANLLELSSREPKSVEKNVRTLIQELVDTKVEPEEFCDRLERLLNASPQPCLIGFLKKSLPLLRQSLITKELTIDGIRPPPANVVFSIATSTTTVQNQIRPQVATSQVRIVAPSNASIIRPGQTLQQRLVAPIRGVAPQPRMIATTGLRQPTPNVTNPVIVSSSQPPALHPVFPQTGTQVRTAINVVRTPIQVRATMPGQIRPVAAIRTTTPLQVKPTLSAIKTAQASKPIVPSMLPKPTAKEKEKKSFSSAGYTGDDDINDVAAMGGVNLAEETQRILGSTEFVGTQIRSCKDEIFLPLGTLQQRIRKTILRHGIDESSSEVSALLSHSAQEYLKNVVEKLAVTADHRIESIKTDPRYEITHDIKGQLKFLEELDRAERKRHEEQERELLLRAAKSRSKSEDPEQAKLKAKAKEMQRVEMEELRQREANATALQAIGPRKKPRLDGDLTAGSSQVTSISGNSTTRGQLPVRQRMKKVSLKDVQFLMEHEKTTCRSITLYKSYLK